MTDLVAWQVKGQERIVAPCVISFHWYYSTKHDFDNIAFAKKYVLDGMVKVGILLDDSQKWVLGFSDAFIRCHPGKEKIIIYVEENDE